VLWKLGLFGNKILLIASHRYVITHGILKMIYNKKLQDTKFILCNDILIISTPNSKWKSGELIAVFPLMGLRISRHPKIDLIIEQDNNNNVNYRFAIIPQNKNFTPNESNLIGSCIIICLNEKEQEEWIDWIEDAVDEEEHSLRPCNPVDLEKKIKKRKNITRRN